MEQTDEGIVTVEQRVNRQCDTKVFGTYGGMEGYWKKKSDIVEGETARDGGLNDRSAGGRKGRGERKQKIYK